MDTNHCEPERTRTLTVAKLPCTYARENVYFSTAARPEDIAVTLQRLPKVANSLADWLTLEIVAIYTRADHFRLNFAFEHPLPPAKSIPLDRIPARQIDVNVDDYVSVRDLDTGASYATIEELRQWVQTPSLPPMGELVSFRLAPGIKVRFRMNVYSVGAETKCALNMLGPIS